MASPETGASSLGSGPPWIVAPIRQSIESIVWTLKTASGSNATTHEPSTAGASGSPPNCSPSPPESDSNHYLNRPSRTLAELSR
jgi:hypothetical protein